MARAVGTRVVLHGLQAKPELNGKTGLCTAYAADKGRYTIQTDDGSELSLKAENLSPVRYPFRIAAESSALQGCRETQEDRHVKVPDLTKAARLLKMSIDHLPQPCALFGVYDGHCGQQCSDYIAKTFHMKLLKKLSAEKTGSAWTDERIEEALRTAAEELDTDFLLRYRTAKDGSTLVVVLVIGQKLFTAWAGDSRCVLGQEKITGETEAIALSLDHRPANEDEQKRIADVGGEVVALGDGIFRVAMGGYAQRVLEIKRAEQQGLGCIGKDPVAMAVSRSLGDRDFKKVTRGADIISATPEVKRLDLDQSHRFVVLMSDGITDVMMNQEVVNLLETVSDPKAACVTLVQEALARGTGDNVTAVLVRLEWNDDFDQPGALINGGDAKRPKVETKLCDICGGVVNNKTNACTECGVEMG